MDNFGAIVVQVFELSQEKKTLLYLMLAKEFDREGMSSVSINVPFDGGKKLQVASAVVCYDITELEVDGGA